MDGGLNRAILRRVVTWSSVKCPRCRSRSGRECGLSCQTTKGMEPTATRRFPTKLFSLNSAPVTEREETLRGADEEEETEEEDGCYQATLGLLFSRLLSSIGKEVRVGGSEDSGAGDGGSVAGTEGAESDLLWTLSCHVPILSTVQAQAPTNAAFSLLLWELAFLVCRIVHGARVCAGGSRGAAGDGRRSAQGRGLTGGNRNLGLGLPLEVTNSYSFVHPLKAAHVVVQVFVVGGILVLKPIEEAFGETFL